MIQVKTMYRDTDEDTVSPGDMLANAIILQAVRDFRHARKRLRRSPDDREANITIREIVRFFSSRYFCLLTRL